MNKIFPAYQKSEIISESNSIISENESSESSAPNLFNAFKKCDQKNKKEQAKNFLKNKRNRAEDD